MPDPFEVASVDILRQALGTSTSVTFTPPPAISTSVANRGAGSVVGFANGQHWTSLPFPATSTAAGTVSRVTVTGTSTATNYAQLSYSLNYAVATSA
jgi:hypothetical protein